MTANIVKRGTGFQIQLPPKFANQYVTIGHNGSKKFAHTGENSHIFVNEKEAKSLGIEKSGSFSFSHKEVSLR